MPVELYVAVIVVSVIESTVITGAVGYGIKVVTDFVVGVGPPAFVGFTTKVYVVVSVKPVKVAVLLVRPLSVEGVTGTPSIVYV